MQLLITILSNSIHLSLKFETYIFLKRGTFKKKKRGTFVDQTDIHVFILSLFKGILTPKIPVEYNVLLNAGSVAPLIFSAGHHQSILLENLTPSTQYETRIQACQNGESLSDTRPGFF